MADIEDIRTSLLQLQELLQHDPWVGDEDAGGGEDAECSVFDYVSDTDTVYVDADLCLDLSFESGEINDGKQPITHRGKPGEDCYGRPQESFPGRMSYNSTKCHFISNVYFVLFCRMAA